MARSSIRTTLAVTLASLALASCSPKRPRFATTDSPLKLDRVVLYRNGVGYFERTGGINGDLLTIKVRKDQVNDLLKSLTIVERGTGRAVSVSMPLDPQTWANAALATLRPGQGSLAEILDALRGTHVTLSTTGATVRGRIAMVEQLRDTPRETGEAPKRIDHRVSLLDGDQLRVVLLSTVTSMQIDDGDLAMQFNRTLDASAGEGMFQQVSVSVRLAGASSHDLLVSYVVAAPMWKPTYRVVLPKDGKGKALLQAWAVVDNTSGEEWKNVNLALTSGAPIAFRYDLHTPRTIERPDLTSRGVQRQAEALVGETSYEPSPEPSPAAAEMADKKMEKEEGRYNAPSRRPSPKTTASRAPSPPPAPPRSGPMGGAGYDRSAAAADELEDAEQQTIDYDSLRRTTLAQAKAQTVSGQTRFELGERVTVPEGTSTMVAIINADVEGEETFLFKPGGAGMGYESNPYRVVKFKNSTPFVLEPGPIGIYSNGSFVGEGLSETVGAATSATIPFAVETGIMVASTRADDRDDMRLIKMSRGVLEVEQFARRTTIYTVKSPTLDTGFTVLIRHPKTGSNFILADRPTGTEDLPDAYVVRLTVAKGSREGTITLVEQTPSRSTITIWNKPAVELLEKLLVHADVGADTKKKLKPIIDKRRELAKIEEQIAGITDRRNQIDQRAGQIRAALDSLSKNPQGATQRAKFAKQLEDFTSEGNRLGVQLADLEAKRLDRRVELEDALQELDITAPPTKKSTPPAKP